jgi:hypothetical protein
MCPTSIIFPPVVPLGVVSYPVEEIEVLSFVIMINDPADEDT